MTQISNPDPVISHQINGSSESVTVPAGETWRVMLWCSYSSSNGNLTINGERVVHRQDRNVRLTTVVTDGDTISVDNTGSIGYVFGRDVSGTVDNTPVSVALGNSESVSVPTGETWHVTIAATYDNDNGTVQFNGSFMFHTRDDAPVATITLEAGHTIAMDGSISGHVGGFKL